MMQPNEACENDCLFASARSIYLPYPTILRPLQQGVTNSR